MNRFIAITAATLAITILFPVNARAAEEDTYLSHDIQQACVEAGEKYNICPELLMAIIERESRGKEDAVNGGCKGLMQVNEYVHKERMKELGVTDLYDGSDNIMVAADYLKDLFDQDEDIYLVLMKYSMSHDKAEQLYGKGVFTKYAVEVADRSAELERAHGK